MPHHESVPSSFWYHGTSRYERPARLIGRRRRLERGSGSKHKTQDTEPSGTKEVPYVRPLTFLLE